MNIEHYLSSFIIGLLGAGHCLGMCGGISAALTFSIDKTQINRRLKIIFAYNFGRIFCYALMGAVVAFIGSISEHFGFLYMRYLAGVLMILMAFYISGVWKILTTLERGGKVIWVLIQPLGKRLMPVKSAYSALLLGALWGWLPCGLVYTALAFSATSASVADGAISMLLFGLGTLPAVITGGLLADKVKMIATGPWFKYLMAAVMLFLGVWTIYNTIKYDQHRSNMQEVSIQTQGLTHFYENKQLATA